MPFEGDTLYAVLHKIVTEDPVSPAYVRQDILLVAGFRERVAGNARLFLQDEPWKGMKWSEEQKRTLRSAHYLIGLKAMAAGHRAGARERFGRAYSVASSKIADEQQNSADRAMELLRQAVKVGYKDVVRLKDNTDLDPIRGREHFKKPLADLENKR